MNCGNMLIEGELFSKANVALKRFTQNCNLKQFMKLRNYLLARATLAAEMFLVG